MIPAILSSICSFLLTPMVSSSWELEKAALLYFAVLLLLAVKDDSSNSLVGGEEEAGEAQHLTPARAAADPVALLSDAMVTKKYKSRLARLPSRYFTISSECPQQTHFFRPATSSRE
jgi:hypothetical protein